MNVIAEKVATLWPEIALAIGATLCLFTGLSPLAAVRKSTAWIAAIALFVAGLLIPLMPLPEHVIGLGGIVPYVKMAVVLVGLILLLVAANLPGQLRQVRDGEAAATFEPGNVFRGEFFAFFLFSLIGVMLTAGADELVWLFLALELTSLPTYVMVAVSRDRVDAQESAVKYFFLGALSAAIFLYGFALIYGATGFTDFAGIAAVAQQQIADNGQISELFLIGIVLAIVGICFKIAAFPMHFYAADVYEGASTAVTAFLAFVPKTAGFVALILILGLVGWHPLPTPIVYLLWAIAALTMTIGNVLGLVQNNVKRVLAYSSIAHSGYILVGLLAGTALTTEVLDDGIAAVLFYLVAYGLGTIAGFAVLGSLTARGEEAQTFDDLAGLSKRSPFLAALMAISMLSLLGLPPLVGFVGKIYLFGSALKAGYLWLVIIAVINSAISAGYYLRIAAVCYFGEPSKAVSLLPVPSRRLGAAIAAIAAVFLGIAGGSLVQSARQASTRPLPASVSDTPAQPISAQGLLQAPAAASEHPL
jgi:NADH-quinone oxidoreductase subunit N